MYLWSKLSLLWPSRLRDERAVAGSNEEGSEKVARPMSQEERDAERRKMQEERQRRAVSVSLHMQSCGERIGQRKKSSL